MSNDLSPLSSAPEAADPAETPSASPADQLGAVLAQAMKPVVDGTNQRFEQMERGMQGLAQMVSQQQGMAQARQQGPTDAPSTKESQLDRLVADPEAWRRAVIEEAETRAAQRVAPYILGVNQDAQERTIAAEVERFDAKHGDGSFEKVIRPHLDSALANMAEPLRYHPRALKTAIAAVKGSPDLEPEIDRLREEATSKRAAAAAESRKKPPSFLGVPRGTGRSEAEDFDEIDRQAIAAIAKSGMTISEEEWKQTKALPRGASFEDQLELLDRQTKGRRAS